jgi:hypothetical protein
MTRYLLSIEQPDGPPPADIDMDEVMRRVGALIDEAKERGAWVFNGGLHPPHASTVVRVEDGELVITDGPYAEGKEHIGGLLIVDEPDIDGALKWARRTAEILTLPIEVRPFQDEAPG